MWIVRRGVSPNDVDFAEVRIESQVLLGLALVDVMTGLGVARRGAGWRR
jgi:hypothetical protein